MTEKQTTMYPNMEEITMRISLKASFEGERGQKMNQTIGADLKITWVGDPADCIPFILEKARTVEEMGDLDDIRQGNASYDTDLKVKPSFKFAFKSDEKTRSSVGRDFERVIAFDQGGASLDVLIEAQVDYLMRWAEIAKLINAASGACFESNGKMSMVDCLDFAFNGNCADDPNGEYIQ